MRQRPRASRPCSLSDLDRARFMELWANGAIIFNQGLTILFSHRNERIKIFQVWLETILCPRVGAE